MRPDGRLRPGAPRAPLRGYSPQNEWPPNTAKRPAPRSWPAQAPTEDATAGPLEPETGIEPVTPTLPRLCSTPELLGPSVRLLDLTSGSREGDGGQWRIRTSEGVSQQIYSLPPLAAWVTARRIICAATDASSIITRGRRHCQGAGCGARLPKFDCRAGYGADPHRDADAVGNVCSQGIAGRNGAVRARFAPPIVVRGGGLSKGSNGADGRARTDNLRFTKPLLCH